MSDLYIAQVYGSHDPDQPARTEMGESLAEVLDMVVARYRAPGAGFADDLEYRGTDTYVTCIQGREDAAIPKAKFTLTSDSRSALEDYVLVYEEFSDQNILDEVPPFLEAEGM